MSRFERRVVSSHLAAGRHLPRAATAIAVLFAAAIGRGNTYTVTTTGDSGPGSLRQAILDANANAGADTIQFAIPGADPGCDGSGVCTIKPQSALALITSRSRSTAIPSPGAAPNTNATGAINAVLKIVVSGVDDPNALELDPACGSAPGRTARSSEASSPTRSGPGSRSGRRTSSCGAVSPAPDASGMTAAVNDGMGIGGGLGGGAAVTIGGPQPADRNLINSVSLDGIAAAPSKAT
jgi:hypothetical protein